VCTTLNVYFLLFVHNIISFQRAQRLLHKKCFQKPYDIDTPTSVSAKLKRSENFKFKPPIHHKSKTTKTRTVHVFDVLEQFFEPFFPRYFVYQFFLKQKRSLSQFCQGVRPYFMTSLLRAPSNEKPPRFKKKCVIFILKVLKK